MEVDFGGLPYAGLYILIDSKRKAAYVGEAKDLLARLRTHVASPPRQLQSWDAAYVVNDGRPAAQSDLNDPAIRHNLELFAGKLLKANGYAVVSTAQGHPMNPAQRPIVEMLWDELGYVLKKLQLAPRDIGVPGQEEISKDRVEQELLSAGHSVTDVKTHEAMVDQQPTYIRPGSSKEKGWQITFRGRFKKALQRGEGHLFFRRGPGFLIPLSDILNNLIQDKTVFGQDTIDIYIEFSPTEVWAKYREWRIPISQYRIGV